MPAPPAPSATTPSSSSRTTASATTSTSGAATGKATSTTPEDGTATAPAAAAPDAPAPDGTAAPDAEGPRRRARPVPRRSQRDRRAATRQALLDAAAASIIDVGYAATTTTVIVQRAGVSQGALFKHFPTKAALLARTAEHLYERLVAVYLDRFDALDRETDLATRLDRAIRLLWELFESPEWAASLDLVAASRSDADLNLHMEDVVVAHAHRLRAHAVALFPEVADHPDLPITLDLLLEAMQGMALSRIADPDTGHYRELVDHLCALTTERLLTAAAPATAPAPRRRR